MTKLQCPLCEETKNFRPVFDGSHKIVECEACELIFSDRVMNPDFFDFYKEDQGEFYERPYFNVANEKGYENPDNPNYREALTRARKQITQKNPRLLDIGCGTGNLLKMAREVGFQAEGLEVSISISKSVADQFPIHVYDGQYDHLPVLPPFDAVAVWDVLEHLPDPVGFLRAMKKLIKPNGKLILRTINEDCLLSQLSLWMYRVTGGRFKTAADRMHEIYHVIYYSKGTLSACLKKSGYRIEQYWISEFPAERASSSLLTQVGLQCAYLLQRLLKRTYVQYMIATPEETLK